MDAAVLKQKAQLEVAAMKKRARAEAAALKTRAEVEAAETKMRAEQAAAVEAAALKQQVEEEVAELKRQADEAVANSPRVSRVDSLDALERPATPACDLFAQANAFLKTLGIDDGYLDPKHNRCYCAGWSLSSTILLENFVDIARNQLLSPFLN